MAGQNVLRAFDWTGWVPGRMGVVQVVKPQYLWMGKTTSKADGTWTITLDGANFEEIMSVSATVQVPSGNLSDQCIATVKSVTTGPNGSITGTVVTSNSSLLGGLLSIMFSGWKFSTTPQTVYVQVFGRSPK